MATSQFKTDSPYTDAVPRVHDVSDYKYQTYTENVSRQALPGESDGKKVTVFAIFGLGRAGSIHLANMLGNPRIEVRYIIEANESIWNTVSKRWNLSNTKFLLPKDAQVALQDKGVQACLIATPTFEHENQIITSLEAGKAVFCEKPVSETIEGTMRCYEKSKSLGVPLFCAFQRRFDPSFASVREQVRQGKIGHVHLMKSTSRDSPLPSIGYLKISGGIFHDCAVHDIDMITWVLGEYPTQVFSVANAQIPEIKAINDVDNVVITLKFESGTIGLIDISRLAVYGYDQRIEVFGPKGMLQVNNDTPNKAVLSDISGSSQVPIFYSFPSRYSDGYRRELEHFLDVIEGNAEISVTGRMTAAVTKIAEACEQSAKTSQPVNLTWNNDELPPEFTQKRTA